MALGESTAVHIAAEDTASGSFVQGKTRFRLTDSVILFPAITEVERTVGDIYLLKLSTALYLTIDLNFDVKIEKKKLYR